MGNLISSDTPQTVDDCVKHNSHAFMTLLFTLKTVYTNLDTVNIDSKLEPEMAIDWTVNIKDPMFKTEFLDACLVQAGKEMLLKESLDSLDEYNQLILNVLTQDPSDSGISKSDIKKGIAELKSKVKKNIAALDEIFIYSYTLEPLQTIKE